ncbi:hypothetical protein EYF80_066144 [Liparis tanakae]|uniref:Uncharacterized protein n=1 Tax=Liparis tanakae TaxID=230148 RepID=A0A4Z2E528_9TELE|nr:hypothetical protein EYF80_066144 [Liparis tanakae]
MTPPTPAHDSQPHSSSSHMPLASCTNGLITNTSALERAQQRKVEVEEGGLVSAVFVSQTADVTRLFAASHPFVFSARRSGIKKPFQTSSFFSKLVFFHPNRPVGGEVGSPMSTQPSVCLS